MGQPVTPAAILRPAFDFLVGVAILGALVGLYRKHGRGSTHVDASDLEPPTVNCAKPYSFSVESELGELELVDDDDMFSPKDGQATAPSDSLCSGGTRIGRNKKTHMRVSTEDSASADDDDITPHVAAASLGRAAGRGAAAAGLGAAAGFGAAGRRGIERLGHGLGSTPRLVSARSLQSERHRRLTEPDEIDWDENDDSFVE